MNDRLNTLVDRVLDQAERRLGWNSRQVLIALLALVAVFMMFCVGSAVVVQSLPVVTPSPTPIVAFPNVAQDQVTGYLQQVGVSFTRTEQLAMPSNLWKALQGIQLYLPEANDQAVVLLTDVTQRG